MGHLSLLELMAACGHFSPLLSLQSWEWEERREKERGEERRMGERGGSEEDGGGRRRERVRWEGDPSPLQARCVLRKCTGLFGRG